MRRTEAESRRVRPSRRKATKHGALVAQNAHEGPYTWLAMSEPERTITIIQLGLLAVILAGLVHRRLFRLCYAFAAYVGLVLAAETLIFLWPDRFWVWPFFTAKETTYGGLKLAILLEITALTYQVFPSARAAVRRLLLGVMLLILGLLTIGIPAGADFADLVRELLRRLAQGTAMAYLATWSLLLWYRLPLHHLHRAILRGLVPYLTLYAASRTIMLSDWNERRVLVNVVEMVAYALVLAYWAWEVWRKPPPAPDFMRTLQPWRDRLR
jgi:hypothetical protein